MTETHESALTKLAASLTAQKRESLAKDGKALKQPGGEENPASFPIPDVEHLKAAIQAFGRAKPEDKDRLKNLIKKRAKELGHPELIPDSWKSDTVAASAEDESALVRLAGKVPPQFLQNIKKKQAASDGGDSSKLPDFLKKKSASSDGGGDSKTVPGLDTSKLSRSDWKKTANGFSCPAGSVTKDDQGKWQATASSKVLGTYGDALAAAKAVETAEGKKS